MNKMPKKVINDYIFYKIVCLDNSVELCYVGSTADFNKRRNTHKSDCYNQDKANYNSKIYKTIRENGGWDNFKMIQLGTREQLNKRQAEQVEEDYRIDLKANMNSHRCYITEEQKKENMKKYYEENKDKILEQKQKYIEENKDKILKYQQKYNEENKDKILKYQQKYNEENKDKIKERQNKYNEENKDKIKEQKKEKVKCECGCDVLKRELLKHQKTKKHIKLMEIKTENENI